MEIGRGKMESGGLRAGLSPAGDQAADFRFPIFTFLFSIFN
jgi:hypothetical protein